MFKKIYIEITNICNLACSFCHGTSRKGRVMSPKEFEAVAERVKEYGSNFFLHVMGEPLSHPQLGEILDIAYKNKMPLNITTNGTLLAENTGLLLNSEAVRKVSVSLHAFEGADISGDMSEYIENCIDFAKKCAENKKICVLRLWNLDSESEKGANTQNEKIINKLKEEFLLPWTELFNGYKLKEYVFLEWGEKFTWPDLNEKDYGEEGFCYGLRSQIAILADGSVTPCCLDGDGVITLGNIFENTLEEIINTPRAKLIKEGFNKRQAAEELCRKCGYAQRFKR